MTLEISFMKKIYTFLFILLGFTFQAAAQYAGGSGSGASSATTGNRYLTNIFQTDGLWNVPANWRDNVVPTTAEEATVAAQSTLDAAYVYPEVHILASGAITIPENTSLTATDLMTNQAGTTGLLVKDNGSLIFPNTGVNGTVERLIVPAQYHYISSPVVSTTAGDVFPPSTYLRWYDETQPTTQWINMVSADLLQPMHGYSAYIPTGTTTATFGGELNAGNQSISGLTYTNNSTVNYDGYNLVGNPYPSSIDIDNAGVILSNLSGTFYFWNPSLNGGLGAYSSWVKGSSGTGNNGATNIIPVGQGFFVKTTDANGELSFTNQAHVHGAQPFNKSSENNVLRLKLSQGEMSDETVIRYLPEASPQREDAFDAIKLKNSLVNNLYTRSEDGIDLAINTYSYPGQTDEIAVTADFVTGGNYTITLSGAETVEGIYNVYLTDQLSGAKQNMRQNPVYQFSANAGTAQDRFVLTFPDLGIDDEIVSNPGIYAIGKSIHVQLPEAAKVEVSIFALTGQLVQYEKFSTQGDLRFETSLKTGIYLVRVTSAGRTWNGKINIQ